MRIFDYASGRTITEHYADKPEQVVRRIAAEWMLKSSRRTDPAARWGVQVYDRDRPGWRDLNDQEHWVIDQLAGGRVTRNADTNA